MPGVGSGVVVGDGWWVVSWWWWWLVLGGGVLGGSGWKYILGVGSGVVGCDGWIVSWWWWWLVMGGGVLVGWGPWLPTHDMAREALRMVCRGRRGMGNGWCGCPGWVGEERSCPFL